MREELKSCEHKQTIVVDNSLAEWCEDCGAFRIKKGNIWWWGEWYYPNTRPAASVPSVEQMQECFLEMLKQGEKISQIYRYKKVDEEMLKYATVGARNFIDLLTERK